MKAVLPCAPRRMSRYWRFNAEQVAEPRIAVFVSQRDARAHFVAVGLGVEIVAFGVGALVEVFLQGQGGGGLAAAANAHHHKMRRHVFFLYWI